MKFHFRRLLRHIYIALFESRRRGVKVTPNRLLILTVFLFVMVPLFLTSGWISWLLDKLLFPGFRQVTVREPVFIIGNMRSGTTFLHRLMARDTANFCTLKTWELGFAPTITQRKILTFVAHADAALGGLLARLVRGLDRRVLGQIKLHPSGLFEAEEDELILLYVWSSTFALGVFPYPDEILNYVLPFDDMPEERARVMPFYKGALQRHLYHHRLEDKHILSKNPPSSSRVDALYETFPDARFIYLIRNPLDVVASMFSYGRMVWKDFQGGELAFPYDEYIWAAAVKWYGYTLDRLAEAPPESYVIVNFNDLTHDPRRVVTEIYEHFGLNLSPEFDETLVEATKRAREYESDHEYSFEGTGFSRDQVLEAFGHLIEQYGFEKEKHFTVGDGGET